MMKRLLDTKRLFDTDSSPGLLIAMLLTALATALVLPMAASAQDTGTVEGVVTDAETETTVPGASVLLREPELGAVTNAEGRYEITSVPTGQYTLVTTFVGYQDNEQTVTVGAGETATVDVTLRPKVTELEQVTVTGLRLEPGEEATGSTVAVESETIEEQNVQNAAEALQGRAAGVRVTSTNGSPGSAFSVQVRGQGSINAGTEPIYIIDGVQISTGEDNAGGLTSYSPLAAIDPSNIESIRVLKDAAASSIYGARAANGVVLITTKQGVAGETRINFSTKIGAVKELNSDYEVLSPTQWGNYIQDAANLTTGRSWEDYADRHNLPLDPDSITGPNWFDAIRRTGITQNYDLSVSGGNEKTRFYLSGGFETLKGQYIQKDGKQYNLQAKLDHSITEDLQLGANINLSTFSKDGDITGGIYVNSPIYAPYLIQPHYQIYEDPDNPNLGYNFDTGAFFNGVALANYTDRKFNSNQIIGNLNLSWTIFPWLTARSQAGVAFDDRSSRTRRDGRIPDYAPGSATASDFREMTLNVKQLFNYDFQFGDKHNLSGLAGTEYRREYEQSTFARSENFPYYTLRRVASGSNPTSASQAATESRLLSFLGEAEYDYDSRYIGRVTGRVDGSSRFGSENRYGLFGSVSAAWRISEEQFMEDVGFVDNLKLRASYGITGNSEINDFVAAPLFGGGGEYGGNPGLQPQTLGNVDLTWEESRPLEVGLDYAFFGNRLFGNVNVYNIVTDQLLLNRTLPNDSGFGSTLQNAGKIQNRGVEVALNTINVDAGGFQWSTNFNISFQDSEVLEVPGDTERDTLVNTAQPGGAYYVEGEDVARYYYPEAAGVNPADGRPMYYDADGNLTYNYPTVDSYKFFGNVLADFYGGLGNSFSYKGITLSGFFQFDYGRVADDTDLSFQDAWNDYNKSTAVLDYWQEPGDVTDSPAPVITNGGRRGTSTGGQYYQLSTYTLEDASYIRLKLLRLGYALPSSLIDGAGIQNASIFVQGKNLVTWTEYTGLDPELVGEQLGEYPQNTTYTMGVNVTF